MATINDIDTASIVRKFLERTVVVDREDESADSAEEISAVLEATALSFLLYPQAALSFVLLAKNVLQQVVDADLKLLDYLIKAVDDVENPNDPIIDTSDLTEAQTALVEVDRLGRVGSGVRAYGRYTSAVNRFLDRQLAKSLKRRRKNEFERSGAEAKQDLFRVLSGFSSTHSVMAKRLELLVNSVSDFQSVDLTRIVATATVSRVRSSLQSLLRAIEQGFLSKTVIALELLAGAASLRSISGIRDIYDPTVLTNSFPPERKISFSSEPVPAMVNSFAGPQDLSAVPTPWVFEVTVNGDDHSFEIPTSGASGRAYVFGSKKGPFSIEVGSESFYLRLDGPAPSSYEPVLIKSISLPTGGVVTSSDVVAALNSVLGSDATAEVVDDRVLIFGSASVTKIVVLSSGRGSFDEDGNYVPANGSAHSVLGFSDEQESGVIGVFSPESLADILTSQVDGAVFTVVDDAVHAETVSREPDTYLEFSGETAESMGFSGIYEADPQYLVLVENGAEVDPQSLGIFVGSRVYATDRLAAVDRNLVAPVSRIDGTHLHFDEAKLPRGKDSDVEVDAPAVAAVQDTIDNARSLVGTFDDDSLRIQQVLSPLLSQPTLAQINNAKKVLSEIRTRVSNLHELLSAEVVRGDRTEFGAVATQISTSLQERGLDRAFELLKSGQFSAFFGLTPESSSKSTRLLNAMEQVGRNDLAIPSAEADLPDDKPRGVHPNDDLLPAVDPVIDTEDDY